MDFWDFCKPDSEGLGEAEGFGGKWLSEHMIGLNLRVPLNMKLKENESWIKQVSAKYPLFSFLPLPPKKEFKYSIMHT